MSLDIGSWDTSNVQNFYGMFYNCSSLTIDLSNWKLNNTVIEDYLYYCSFNYNAPGVIPPSSFGEDAGYSDGVCQAS